MISDISYLLEARSVGKVKYRSGDVYCGHLVKGKRNGFGKYLWTNGNSFEGDWLQGTMHGKGTFKWASVGFNAE